ncbi:hypothetical protein AA313_de0205835 [Arthrobotrys entomopaga]|nr:hypothetical protein AA313_de0205835 [Arthrobotrys entomopaga]
MVWLLRYREKRQSQEEFAGGGDQKQANELIRGYVWGMPACLFPSTSPIASSPLRTLRYRTRRKGRGKPIQINRPKEQPNLEFACIAFLDFSLARETRMDGGWWVGGTLIVAHGRHG